MGIFDIIAGPLAGVVNSIIGALDDDSPEKVQAKAELLRVQQELQTAALDYERELTQAQARIVEAEAKSAHWLTATWRPLVMLTFAAIVVYAAIAPSLFGVATVDMSDVPEKFWQLLLLGIGGYVIGRTGEKVASTAADAYKAKHEPPQ